MSCKFNFHQHRLADKFKWCGGKASGDDGHSCGGYDQDLVAHDLSPYFSIKCLSSLWYSACRSKHHNSPSRKGIWLYGMAQMDYLHLRVAKLWNAAQWGCAAKLTCILKDNADEEGFLAAQKSSVISTKQRWLQLLCICKGSVALRLCGTLVDALIVCKESKWVPCTGQWAARTTQAQRKIDLSRRIKVSSN